MTAHESIGLRRFLVAASVGGCALVAASIFVASREWFRGDDFLFLSFVQQPEWSWVDLYLPFESRHWPFYRPLAAESYFYVCFRLFGFDSLPFYGVLIAVHFLSGLVVYRLAKQLRFDPRVAAVTALLSVSRFPSIQTFFFAANLHHVAGSFFYVLAVTTFLDYARRGRIAAQLGSCVALLLTLLCAEYGVTLVGLLVLVSLYVDDFEISKASLLRALRRAIPQAAIVTAYLVLRFGLIAPRPAAALYTFELGGHMVTNVWQQLVAVFEDEVGLLVAALLILLIVGAILRDRENRSSIGRRLVRIHALCIPWIVFMLAPFSLLPVAALRFSIPIEIPVCLMLGAYLDALWRLGSARHRLALEVGLICLLLVSIPYKTFWLKAENPVGAAAREFKSVIEALYPDPPTGTIVVFLYGAEGLATSPDATRFRLRMMNHWMLRSLYPDKNMRVRFIDVVTGGKVLCDRCVYFKLRPDLSAEPIEKSRLLREIRQRRVGS